MTSGTAAFQPGWGYSGEEQERRQLLADETHEVSAAFEAELGSRLDQLSNVCSSASARVDQHAQRAQFRPAAPRPPLALAAELAWANMPDDDVGFLAGPWGSGYGPPTETEMLPEFLLSQAASEYVELDKRDECVNSPHPLNTSVGNENTPRR